MPPSRWGPIRSLLALSPVLIGAPYLAYRQHSAIPEPLTDLINPQTGLSQISEPRILAFAQHLSEGIGYRTVGTEEHARADAWMVEQAEAVKRQCEEAVKKESGKRKLQCEVWRQEGNGSHRFDMMGKRLYKTYVALSNIVIRISDGTPESMAHAVLVNAHLDSTLPSPGAADDAISVGVMLDCIRVLVDTPGWEPKHAIIFLFNNAEESLQDGSHLFSTQHPVASTVRAAINLEAAGSTGRELLFQATSQEMIEAYSHVPRPSGTVFANDIFSSGIILSDTDFRQFEQYLNVTGLDIAIVGNSYLYHMRKDLVENIQPGVAQNMGENTVALLRHLSSPDSPLATLTTYTRPTTVFFSYLGYFFIYSFGTAKILYAALLLASVILVRSRSKAMETDMPVYENGGAVKTNGHAISNGNGSVIVNGEHGNNSKLAYRQRQRPGLGMGVLAVLLGLVGCIALPNLVAVVMHRVLGQGMSWFANEHLAILLYGPPALLGTLLSQLLLPPFEENNLLACILLLQTGVALLIQTLGVGSAALFFLSSVSVFFALFLDTLFSWKRKLAQVSLVTYALGQASPLFGGVLVLLPTMGVFVPLTGRIGPNAPADNIIATIVSAISALAFPLSLPFIHRFGRRAIKRGAFLAAIVTVGVMAVFARRTAFDAMHQRRVFFLFSENITSGEHSLLVASADGAPGFEALVQSIKDEFIVPSGRAVDGNTTQLILAPEAMDEDNTSWDVLYPFSTFLKSYKIPLAIPSGYVSPWIAPSENGPTITALNDITDYAAGTRSLTLSIYHPGLIWTVVAFDAHVLKWNLDGNPPDEYARHRVKEASFFGQDVWTIELVLKIVNNEEKLKVNFMGTQERGMWPGKMAVKEQGGIAMQLFEEFDGWFETKTSGTADAMLLGSVTGVFSV